jgi:hypothetical protein
METQNIVISDSHIYRRRMRHTLHITYTALLHNYLFPELMDLRFSEYPL